MFAACGENIMGSLQCSDLGTSLIDDVPHRAKPLSLWSWCRVHNSDEKYIFKSIYMKLLSFSEVTTAVNFVTGR